MEFRLKVNREIRAPRVRLITQTGEQIGVVPLHEALARAEENGLDLVEISAGSNPPVCKIINYGKFRYDQTKKEKESKKAQHQVKIKEIKVKPNIDIHDLETKIRHARDFIAKGNKVKLTCMFRGREMAHPEIGEKVLRKVCEDLEEIATVESPSKLFGRMLIVILAPGGKKKKEGAKGLSNESQPTREEESA
ncbi:Translation initiation factor IF-3 [Neochlamydia sp. TUME1]|uniref:translation initiation factor IF-3 n=1 Tax=Neochlamydia sp. TUME1 TaxID=1478174 RepID=UPI000582738F|nr:Translation initiation factor IF-3 [Neochlamydia sp. TUME1]